MYLTIIWVVVEVSTGTVMCCYNSMCTGMYRVGMNVPLKTNRTNKYAHVPLCHERARRTVCSVGRVRGACCPSLLKQLVIWVVVEVSTGTVMCCYNSMCTGMYPVGTNVPLKTNRANKYSHRHRNFIVAWEGLGNTRARRTNTANRAPITLTHHHHVRVHVCTSSIQWEIQSNPYQSM